MASIRLGQHGGTQQTQLASRAGQVLKARHQAPQGQAAAAAPFRKACCLGFWGVPIIAQLSSAQEAAECGSFQNFQTFKGEMSDGRAENDEGRNLRPKAP